MLNYLVLQRSKGNYAAAAAINAAAVNGFIAEPAADSTQAEPIQDAEPNPWVDKLFNFDAPALDEFMAKLQKRFINEIQGADLEDPVFAMEDTVFKNWGTSR